ncbi:MAG TPA: hypothetical protein VFA10_15685 [Ktedonobacteraceae bacterium]|nr:hypothetical protein [Ktedonobacteraceae bacterium]
MMHPIDSSYEGEEQRTRKHSAVLWGTLQRALPNARQQRLTFLLFNCGLSPREIVSHCSQEFGTVQEIVRLRRIIFEQVMQNHAFQSETVPAEEQQQS